MREMKDSGIEWIGQIPKDWKVPKIKYVAKFLNGDRGKNYPSGNDLTDSGIVFLTSNNIRGVVLDCTSDITKYITEKRYNILGGAKIRKNDIIFCLRGSVGNCAINKTENEGTIASSLVDIRPIKVIAGFLNYCLKSDINSIQTSINMNGSCAANLSAENVANYCFIEPSISEQQQIADFLDTQCSEIDATAEDIQKEISLLEDYKKSVITEAVTKGLNPDAEMKDSGIEWIGEIPKYWKVLRIKNVGEYRNGLTYKPTDLTDEKTGTLVLRSSNIQDGKISLKDNVYVSTFVRSDLKVKKGDILICSRNGSRELVGKNAIIEDLKDVTFGAFMMIFRCDSPKYLYYILNSKVFSYYLGSFFTSTINQLTGSNFGNMKIVYVSDKLEQSKIVSYLDDKCSEIDTLIADKKRQLDILADYKKSLIYEYVTGKKEVPVNE